MPTYQATIYPPAEERFNIWSHGIGFVLSVAGTLALLIRASQQENQLYTLSFAIYGASMIILYAASTLYHSATQPTRRNRLNILDHASIYLLIAGTYTPFSLITLAGSTGSWLLIAIWSSALAGVVFKLFFTGRFDKLSTLFYVFMGSMVVFAIKPLMANLPIEGVYWLFAGGASYITGAVFYSIPKLPFNHAIFHVFVLGGSICHFVSIYFYVV
jgi:hemolysin III